MYRTFDDPKDPETAAKERALHAEGKGIFTVALLGFTFVPLSGFSQSADSLQKTLLSAIEASLEKCAYPSGLRKQYELQKERIREKWPSAEIITFPGLLSAPKLPESSKKYLTLCAGLNHPFARGSVVYHADPLAFPAIDPAVFAEPYDLATMVETVKFIRRAAKEEPLKSLLSGVELNPGEEYQTDEEIADSIGSASMMPLEDDGVVDANLKVYKTSGFRIRRLFLYMLALISKTFPNEKKLRTSLRQPIEKDMPFRLIKLDWRMSIRK